MDDIVARALERDGIDIWLNSTAKRVITSNSEKVIHIDRAGKLETIAVDEILIGATIVACHAGEMISEITPAMVGKTGLGTIANVIHPYPNGAQAIKQESRRVQSKHGSRRF